MDKRTVIISKTNEDHTAYVMNYGIDEISLFKELKDNGLELKNKQELSDGEILMLLRHCCKDGFVESVISIENHYNRDQKQINIYKENIEQKLKSQGCKIINHCDWKPSFNYDVDVINTRNYLTILTENVRRKEQEIIDLNEEKEILKKDIVTRKKLVDIEIQNYRNNLEKEIKELEEEKQLNTEKIKNQNWYIQETTPKYDKLKTDFDKLVERFRNGTKLCENQLKEAKEKWPEELKKLEENISKHKSELLLLEGKHNEKLNKISYLNEEINNIKEETDKINKINANLEENGLKIIENIFKKINNDRLSVEELKDKFKRTYKMYVLNERNVPDFEIEYFKNAGLSDEDIQEIKNIFN